MMRPDPGDCPICGVAHSACRADSGPITVVQLPARDADPIGPDVGNTSELVGSAPLAAEVVQATLPAGIFTSGTYRREKKKP